MEKIYKEASCKSGTYKLTNKLNGRTYYGSCKRFKERFRGHERLLMKNRHNNLYLQNDFNKCGSDAFVFEVIEVIEGHQKLRLNAEQFLLDQHWDGYKQCYNLKKKAIIPSNETIKKLSKANKNQVPWIKGRNHTKEAKEKISKASKGNKCRLGKRLSKEHSNKLKEALKNRWKNLEFRNKMLAIHKNIPRTDETKKKISEANKGKKRTPEQCKKYSEVQKGKKLSTETKRKMSASRRGKKRGKYKKRENHYVVV